MKITGNDKRVRATVFLLVTRGAKATFNRLLSLCGRVRSSRRDTGKTGGATGRSANRQNEINRARVKSIQEHGATIHYGTLDRPDEAKHFIDENLENEFRELIMAAAAWARDERLP